MSSRSKPGDRPRPSSSQDEAAQAVAKGSGSADAVQSAEREGQRLGRYEIRKKLGSGGMGAVYLAFDPELQRNVAIKVLPRDKAENERLVKRFKAEATAAAQLRHENIVSVYETGEADGYLYIALEYVEGTDVHNLIAKRGPLPVKRSIEIIKQVARALEHAHEKGIVHRDIKPSNLLIRRDGTVKLADMGLARSVDETAQTGITRAGTTVGTVDYMSPEQARDSRAADIRSDLYSLGCTWYHMLTGKPPYSEGSLTNKLSAHATQPPPNPRDINEQVPDAVVAVMHRMMAKAPESRYQSPQELLEDLSGSHLHRGPVSNDVLAGLSQESRPEAVATVPPSNGTAPDAPARSTVARSGPVTPAAPGTNPPPGTMPQRRRRSAVPTTSRDESDGGRINIEPLKVLIVLGGLGTVVWLIWWLVTGFAGSLDTGPVNPFAGGPSKSERIAELTGGGDSPSTVSKDDEEQAVTVVDAAKTQSRPAARPANDRTTGAQHGSGDGRADPPKQGPETSQTVASNAEREAMPQWAVASSPPRSGRSAAAAPRERTVGWADGRPGEYATLAAALRDLPEQGAVIRLRSDGPHFLPPTTIERRGEITITAAPETRPVIVFVPNREGTTDRILQVVDSSLQLAGVHLAAVGRQFAANSESALVEVVSGDLTVRQGSVTLLGERSKRMAAFRVAGSQNRPDRSPANSSRVLLDRVFVRGANLVALDLDQSATDVLVSNCLFATGSAPALCLTSSMPAVPSKNAKSSQPVVDRQVRFIACTVTCREAALELTPGLDKDQPPSTALLTLNSIFAAPPDSPAATLVALPGWPRDARAERGRSLLRRLSFTADASLFAGWNLLISAQPGEASQLQGAAYWQNVWGTAARGSQFDASSWTDSKIATFEAVQPEQLDATTIGRLSVRTADGERPGCRTPLLAVPLPESLERAEAWAFRPAPPEHVVRADGKKIPVDAKDLGRLISSGDWPNGATFVISGTGNIKSSPIKVRGKSFRMLFTDEASGLVVEARPADYKGSTDAFISVTDGSVEIINGQFKIPASSRGETPKWFLSVANGNFSLSGCHLNGPMTDSPRYEAAIRWTGPKSDPKKQPVAGQYERFGRVTDCYLAGEGKTVLTDLRGFGLLFQNSLLVGLDDLFDIDIIGKGPMIDSAVSVDGCTLATNGSFFMVRAANLGKDADSPLRLFASRTVFAPPLDANAGGPALLTYTGLARQQRQIDWWEEANGYAGEIKTFLHGMAASSGSQSFQSGWVDHWGRSRVLRPLSERGGVLMAAAYPAPVRLSVTDWKLNPTCKAARWAADGSAIGADIASIPDGTARTEPPKSSAGESPATRPRRSNNPGF